MSDNEVLFDEDHHSHHHSSLGKDYRSAEHRVFVNRSLHLDKIKFFGFDLDYTIAEYISPEFEAVGFKLLVKRMISIGYPAELQDFEFDPTFPIRGLWFDTLYGNLLKTDAYGNILVCVHGFQFLKTSEIYGLYPNKFLKLDESRVYVMNTLFNLPEAYLLACLVDFFTNSPQYTPLRTGVKSGNLLMSFRSIFQDMRCAFDFIHDKGELKSETLGNLEKYLKRDESLVTLLNRMQEHGKKLFLLTNSDYSYTEKIMSYLLHLPNNKRDWKSFFDYIVVDSRKPLFFGEGTILRQVEQSTGALRIGIHMGPLQPQQVYSGGSCDVFTELICAKGKEVLYIGDHIYGDILKSKKTRGWRTFLIVPELRREIHVSTKKWELFNRLQDLDNSLCKTFKDLDSSTKEKPDISTVRVSIREVAHELDMAYGILGSTFRSGSRQTFFANQICRYADLYGCTFLNLLYYPFSYFFRAPTMMMPHEVAVHHIHESMTNGEVTTGEEEETLVPQETTPKPGRRHSRPLDSLVPHLYAEKPHVVTHHHDTDDEEDTDKSQEQ